VDDDSDREVMMMAQERSAFGGPVDTAIKAFRKTDDFDALLEVVKTAKFASHVKTDWYQDPEPEDPESFQRLAQLPLTPEQYDKLWATLEDRANGDGGAPAGK